MSVIDLMHHVSRDEAGGPLVEAAVLIPILFVFSMGSVDFLNALQQWNSATKAVEVGARIAAVSDPVANGLNTLSTNAVTAGLANLGAPMPAFTVTCNGAGSGTCSCSDVVCSGVAISYNATAMNRIVFGRDGNGTCGDATSYYNAGMCDIFSPIAAANVQIVYTQTGLGYAGRPTPIPTITVSLQGLTFQFFFLGGLSGLGNIQIPPLTTTISGEALTSSAQSPN